MGDFFGKKWKKLLAAALFAAGLLAAFRYALPLAAPFLLAFAVVHASAPLLERVHRRLHIRREILLAGLFVSGTGLLIVGLCACLSWGTLHAARLGEGAEVVRKQADGALKGCCDFLEERLGVPAKELEQDFSETWDALAGQLKKEALPKAVDRSVEGCRLLISAAGFIGIWMIASVLLCRDYEEIAEKIQKTELGKTVWQYAERTLFLIGGYFKAQAAILTAISLIAAAGLFAAGIKNGIWIGIAAGVLDALPFIGTGLVLFPMAVWQLILGNTGKVLMIAAVYAGCVIVREYLEPKLLGRQAGMYPVVMLFSVYAGVKLFGLSGIFLGPLYAVLLKEGIMGINGGTDRCP